MKRRRDGFWFYDHRHAQSADSLGRPRFDHYKVVNLTVGVSSKQRRALDNETTITVCNRSYTQVTKC